MRPNRKYQHTFTHLKEKRTLEFVTEGYTPCNAKQKAFLAIEAELKARPELPRGGWRLIRQQDISHTA